MKTPFSHFFSITIATLPQYSIQYCKQSEQTNNKHNKQDSYNTPPLPHFSLPKGQEMSDHALAEHLEMKQDLKRLDNMGINHEGFDTLLRKIMDELKHHIKDEEDSFLPVLRQCAPQSVLQEMAKQWYAKVDSVATHPHPSAPDKPPFQAIVDKMAAPFDKARDLGREFPEEVKKRGDK